MPRPAHRHAADGVRVEMSGLELPDKPDDQIVVHDHPRAPDAERLMAMAGFPAVRYVAAQGLTS